MTATDPNKLDRAVAEARRAAAKREQGYREQALKILSVDLWPPRPRIHTRQPW